MKIIFISRWTDPAKGGTFATSPSLKATVSKGGGAKKSTKYELRSTILPMAMLLFFNSQSFAQSGSSCSNAISVIPAAVCSPTSYTTTDSVLYFSFTATRPDIQIEVVSSIARCVAGGHPHQLTVFGGTCAALQTIEDEFMPDIAGCTEQAIDASNLTIGATYYIRVSRGDIVDSNCVAARVTAAICFASQPLAFSLCVRSLNIIIPKDFGLEPASISHSYYTNKGQVIDVNGNPRFDIRDYTNNSSPAVYHTDTSASFVFASIDTIASTPDTLHRVDMTLVGANTGTRAFKTEKVGGYLNYFLGHAPSGATNIKGYSRTVNTEVYPNIDMQYYSNDAGVKFYFIVKPGGNADNIVLKFTGANSVSVTPSKGLQITTSLGTIIFDPGHAYQVNPAGNIVPMPWQAEFIQLSPTEVKFDIRNYPAFMPLFIQVDRGHSLPSNIQNLEWSTFFGGNNIDEFFDVKTDLSGNAYAVGYAYSNDFPITPGVVQTLFAGDIDAVVVKFKNTGELFWSTYYGGGTPQPTSSQANDKAEAVTVDNSGNVYFGGSTWSTDFPTLNPSGGAYYQATNPCGGVGYDCTDAFIVKLKSTGDAIIWATYYGGSGPPGGVAECIYDLAIDNQNNLYAVGQAWSATPIFNKAGAYNSAGGGGFVLEFSPQHALLWATKFPGATIIAGIGIDGNNNKFITGLTGNGLPIQNAGGNSIFGGGQKDAFVTKFDMNDALDWSTYYGGADYDIARDIVVDGFGNCYITGRTQSTNASLPLVNPGGTVYFQGTYSGGVLGDAFVSCFNNSGTLIWATYYGGIDSDEGQGIAVDANNNVYLCGNTSSSDFPIPSPNLTNAFIQSTLQSGTGDADAFLVAFTSSRELIWGTYFGGTHSSFPSIVGQDFAYSMATFQNSKLYMVGSSGSNVLFPLDDGGGAPVYFDNSNVIDGFISRFDITIMPIGVNELNSLDDAIHLFPNPSSKHIALSFNRIFTDKMQIKIYDGLGKELLSKNYKLQSGNKLNLDLQELGSGLYFMLITIGDKGAIKKFIITSEK